MNNELIANLTNENEVELIYSTTRFNDDKMFINYTIICDVDNIVSESSIGLCKKIIATMEIIKELLSKYNIEFSYTIKTSHELDKNLEKNKTKTIEKLSKAEIIYCKNDYYQELIDEFNSYKKVKEHNK